MTLDYWTLIEMIDGILEPATAGTDGDGHSTLSYEAVFWADTAEEAKPGLLRGELVAVPREQLAELRTLLKQPEPA